MIPMADGSVIIDILGDDSKFLSKLKNLAGGAVKGLTATLAGATTAVAGLAAGAIKVGSDFETSMSQVAATMGITTEEIANGSERFELLSQAAKDAGATTAFSASEASAALNYLALAGYDAAKAADALPAVLNLAAAGNMDLAYASDLATDAMAALGIEATGANLTTFGDKLARTSSRANTSIAQLGEAILTVGGTAKGLAGGTTELNAALGVLANRGVKGSEGGTALRNMILSLSAPTDKAAKVMKGLGLEVFTSTGQLRPLNEVFKDLDAALAGMGDGEKTQVLNEIFNKVDLKSVQAMLAGCGEEFDNLSEAIANSGGAMQDMADTQLDNLNGDLTILKSGLEGLGISVYEGMQDSLRGAVQLATDMVGQIAAAFKEGGLTGAVDAVGNVLAQIVTKLAEAAPTLIDTGAQLLQSLISGIRDHLPELVPAAFSIISTFAQNILSLLPQLGELGLELFQQLCQGLSEALPEIIPLAVEWISYLVQGFLDHSDEILQAGIELLLALAEGLLAALPVLIENIPVILRAIYDALLAAAPILLNAAVELVYSILEAMPQIITAIVEALPQIILAMVGFFIQSIPFIIEAGIKLLGALAMAIPEVIVTLFMALAEIPTAILKAVMEWGPQMVQAGKDMMAGFIEGITSGFQKAIEHVKNFLGNLVDSVKDLLGIHSPSRVFAGIGDYAMQGLANGLARSGREAAKAAAVAVGNVVKAAEIPPIEGNISTSFQGGFSGALEDANRKMQYAVETESLRFGANMAARSAGHTAQPESAGQSVSGQTGDAAPKRIVIGFQVEPRQAARFIRPYLVSEQGLAGQSLVVEAATV